MFNLRREKESGADEYNVASQWRLMWWKFKKHRLATIAVGVLCFLYFLGAFCEFLSPHTPWTRFSEYLNAPPHRVHFFDEKDGFQLRPFIYELREERDPKTFRRIYNPVKSKKYPLYFLVRGEKYKFWNLFKTDIHLFGTKEGSIFLMGTDRFGRDLFSRSLYGTRISLSIGLVGVFLSFVLGLALGGLAGYIGGNCDVVIMRTVDLLISIPTLPLWMALAAALPHDWSTLKMYFAITVIFSITGWCGLARVVRGKLLSLRQEEFTIAAKLSGGSSMWIIGRHLLPSFLSYIIVTVTLIIPAMILGETALSFLGLGLQPPVVSWGTLLQDAQNVSAVAHHPWLLLPIVFVFTSVLMFNFLGDGLRDAADPYK